MTRATARIPFVDAHVHFWDLRRLDYAWLTPPFDAGGPNGDVSPIAADYLPEDYRRETAGWDVVGAVHVEAGASPAQGLAETLWLEGLAEDGGLPSGIVAATDLRDPRLGEALDAQGAHPLVRGVRDIANWHPDAGRTYVARDPVADPAWRAGFDQLERAGLSFDLQCYPSQMRSMAALLARHEAVPAMIDHMGMPVLQDPDGLGQWRAGIRALAALPNVSIKLSGMGFVARDWTEDLVRPLVLEAIEVFGPDRAMFASDLPTDRLFGSLDRHLSAYHAIVADFTLEERRALFAGNADRLYRLGLDLEKQP